MEIVAHRRLKNYALCELNKKCEMLSKASTIPVYDTLNLQNYFKGHIHARSATDNVKVTLEGEGFGGGLQNSFP